MTWTNLNPYAVASSPTDMTQFWMMWKKKSIPGTFSAEIEHCLAGLNEPQISLNEGPDILERSNEVWELQFRECEYICQRTSS